MLKRLLLAAILLGGAWHFYAGGRPPAVIAAPPEVAISIASVRETPVQRTLARPLAFEVNGYEVNALAAFAVTGRVLSAQRYRSGREADLSPIDLALGWGRMSDPGVVRQLSISQSNRWYFWRYEHQPPIPRREIETSSANMHMIPASPAIARVLSQASAGRVVALRGYLVEVTAKDGWRWRSSLSREDTGDGSCEVVFVQAAELL